MRVSKYPPSVVPDAVLASQCAGILNGWTEEDVPHETVYELSRLKRSQTTSGNAGIGHVHGMFDEMANLETHIFWFVELVMN